MYNFLKSREIGMKPRLGDETNLWKTLYTSIAMFDKGTIEYGGIFNLEFSPDGYAIHLGQIRLYFWSSTLLF